MRQGARRALKIFGILLGVLVLYIVTAGAWAHTVTPTVIARASRAPLIDFRSLPDSTKEILLRVEDPAFRTHKGLDPFTPGQGRSTITRALARTLYLWQERAGRGQVILFADDPNFRASQLSTTRLFFNAVFLGPAFATPGRGG